MSDITVGIDIGTTSVKAVAADGDGKILAQTRVPHEIHAPDRDTFEHDAKAAWVDGVLQAWDTVSDGFDVSAVTVSAMVPSLCGVNDAGIPVTEGVLYGDKRGRNTAVDGTITGEVVGFARALLGRPGVAALWPAQAVANHVLCGVGAIDTTTATTMAPLFTGIEWDADLLAELGLRSEQLPSFMPGALTIGRRGTTEVSGGTIDVLGEQSVADASKAGDVLVVCGTTLIPMALTPDWFDVPGLWTIPYAVNKMMAVGGASNAGGLFIDHVRRITGDPDQADVLAVGPSSRPVWLPYLRGERTPFHDPDKEARLIDFGLGHDPAAILAAAYDAAGFVVRHHLDLAHDQLLASDSAPQRIVATAGGTMSPAWMQALADTTGLPVDVSATAAGAALGAALVARQTANLSTDSAATGGWAKISHRVMPRPEYAEAAIERYVTFREASEQ